MAMRQILMLLLAHHARHSAEANALAHLIHVGSDLH
jgi:hypothetical protein